MDVYVFFTITSIVEDSLANFDTQIIDEIHEFFESTSDDVNVRVESNTPIPTDVHTHDNDTSDAECEPLVESTLSTFSPYFKYRPSRPRYRPISHFLFVTNTIWGIRPYRCSKKRSIFENIG